MRQTRYKDFSKNKKINSHVGICMNYLHDNFNRDQVADMLGLSSTTYDSICYGRSFANNTKIRIILLFETITMLRKDNFPLSKCYGYIMKNVINKIK